MADGWHRSATEGLCSQCDAPTKHYYRIEFRCKEAGITRRAWIATFRCDKHTVKPFHPTREKAVDE